MDPGDAEGVETCAATLGPEDGPAPGLVVGVLGVVRKLASIAWLMAGELQSLEDHRFTHRNCVASSSDPVVVAGTFAESVAPGFVVGDGERTSLCFPFATPPDLFSLTTVLAPAADFADVTTVERGRGRGRGRGLVGVLLNCQTGAWR